MTFGARLAGAMREYGPLCVGIDPHPSLLAEWGMQDDAASLAAFGQTVVEAAARNAAAVKPNIAFFERHGARGLAALELVLKAAREAELLTIMDAKRGDIGSTMAGYADAFLRPGAPLESDALTVSPYLGFGSLQPALDLAAKHGKGIFVLALTSNPEGPEVQHARTSGGTSVAASVTAQAAALNAGAEPMGSIGLVVGATVGTAVADTGTDLEALNGPILAPGVGAQGAGAEQISQVFGNCVDRVLVNQSRGVLKAGPISERLRGAIARAAQESQMVAQ